MVTKLYDTNGGTIGQLVKLNHTESTLFCTGDNFSVILLYFTHTQYQNVFKHVIGFILFPVCDIKSSLIGNKLN